MADSALHDKDGRQKVYSTCKPQGTTTYYAGTGDDPVLGIGRGNRIVFNLLNTDEEKEVDIEFTEIVYIKGGILQIWNAPFGSYFDFHIYHKQLNIEVATYARRVWLNGTQTIYLNSDERAELSTDLFIRMSVHNSNNVTFPSDDPAAAFKVAGVIEMFRATTYNT